jgi:hypothetical protein
MSLHSLQYFLPAREHGTVPLLLWHGGGLTGVSYETTPHGREGCLNYFVKKGWATFNSDAVERERAGWAQYPGIFPGEASRSTRRADCGSSNTRIPG